MIYKEQLLISFYNKIYEQYRKLEEDNCKVLYMCLQYHFESECKDIGVKFIFEGNGAKKYESRYCTLLLDDGELTRAVQEYLSNFEPEKEYGEYQLLVQELLDKTVQEFTLISDCEIELEEYD